MKILWIFAVIFASYAVFATAQKDPSDYVQDEYDSFYDYDTLQDEGKKIDEELDKLADETNIDNDLKVEDEIEQFREAYKDNFDAIDEPQDNLDGIDYDQFEDNRDKSKEETENRKEISSDSDSSSKVIKNKVDEPIGEEEVKDDNSEKSQQEAAADYALLWGDDSIAPLPIPETADEPVDKEIIEETRKILEGNDDFEEEIKQSLGDEDAKADGQADMNEIFDETKNILEETGDSFSDVEPNLNNDAIDNADHEKENENKDAEVVEQRGVVDKGEDEDTVDKAYADLNADLNKLLETMDKLRSDTEPLEDNHDNLETIGKSEDLEEHLEDSYDNVEAVDPKDLEDIFKDNYDTENKNMEGSEELVEQDNDIDLDKLLEDILSEDDMKPEDTAAELDLETMLNDELNEPNPDDAGETDIEIFGEKSEPILYLHDMLLDDEQKEIENLDGNEQNADAEIAEDNAEISVNNPDIADNADGIESGEQKETTVSVQQTSTQKTVPIDDLTSAELNDILSQFSILHKDELDVHSQAFDQTIAPIHITLSLDEPTIITSPEWPNQYPTNNVVDWILEGEGMGIELNITDFAVNGAIGDYLLIKPGGEDDSGHEGIVFTYRLSSERRYRFTDVDRMFVRFDAKMGMMFYTGFRMSVKMIAPHSTGAEPVPEPEPVLSPPHSTTSVTLDIMVPRFKEIEEEFRLLLADMAEQYISDNDIDPGYNTTSEVTQITMVGLCPITWPGYERCTAVTFGVSLAYDEEELDGAPRLSEQDLADMWGTYNRRDPFALRLSRMGVREFFPPDTAMTAWLVIAAGVVVSMVVMAVVLWRFSCSENYTKMKTYSDTDSLQNEKRGLDLYPTPHQTLPPLYSENEYKWTDTNDTTRVDMGGFANRSYARDNMYDFESDEDVITARDSRSGGITSRDNYSSTV